MWQCALCDRIMTKSSGLHRRIRTRSGNHRVAGLCPGCAQRHDRQQRVHAWRAVFGFLGVGTLAALAVYFVL